MDVILLFASYFSDKKNKVLLLELSEKQGSIVRYRSSVPLLITTLQSATYNVQIFILN